jgi:aspartyl protease family protein
MGDLSGDDFGNLIYLVILGSVIAFWFFTAGRRSMNKMLQQAAVWALIFIGAIAAFGMWDDIRSTMVPRQAVVQETGRIEVPRARDGHYYVIANVNDVPVQFVVDTGASGVVLRKEDAAAAGIDLDRLAFVSQAQTANGTVAIARTRTESFGFEGLEIDGFAVSVNAGQMGQSLLGMTYLQQFRNFQIADGVLILER